MVALITTNGPLRKWTSPLERAAEFLPEISWGEATLQHWRGGQMHLVSYSWVSHQPQSTASSRLFAELRHKKEGDMFWPYCFIEVESGRGHDAASSQAAFERY